MSAYKVLIPQDIPKEGKDYLLEKGYEIKMGSGISVEQIKADVADCDALLVRTAPYPAEVLEAGPGLKVVARFGVGVDNIDVKRATELGIQVTNGRDSNAGTVSELVLGFIIGLGRNMALCDRETRRGNFGIRSTLRGVDITGKTLGILGMGKIGQLVAEKARLGLGMNVIGYDPFLAADQFPTGVAPVMERDSVFKDSDFVTVHMPATDETRGSIGMREFRMMNPGAFFINAARGEIVVEEELVAALEDGEIRGAGLDVYSKEPPAADNPLFALDTVMLTPHNASLTEECMARMALHAAQGVHEVLSGKKPSWPVNRLD